jgi:hypothetical protein
MNTNFLNLYNEFLELLNKGDEAAARKFVTDNIKNFPEEVQDKIIFAFFEDAVNKEAAGIQGVAEIQKEGMEAMSQIEKAKKILEDQVKAEELKAKIVGEQ